MQTTGLFQTALDNFKAIPMEEFKPPFQKNQTIFRQRKNKNILQFSDSMKTEENT